jgi:hypothetical protein
MQAVYVNTSGNWRRGLSSMQLLARIRGEFLTSEVPAAGNASMQEVRHGKSYSMILLKMILASLIWRRANNG